MHRILTIFREPLVVFSLTAAAVFGLFMLTAPDKGPVIEITSESFTTAVENREMLLARDLSQQERAELIEQLVTQEILVREAIARDFHVHDSKTRARLVSQMNFVMSEDAPEPSKEDLARLQAQDPNRYMLPKSVSFDHVFFETDELAAQDLMSQINAGRPIPADAGDRFWLGNRMEYYTAQQILTVLGQRFAAQLQGLTPGVWSGPFQSGRGWHLVRLDTFHAPGPLPETELDRVLREVWKQNFHTTTFNGRLDDMRENYRIVLPETTFTGTQIATIGGD